VTITHLLAELAAGGAGELLEGLSVFLTPRAGSTANAALFESDQRVRPTFRMEIKTRDPSAVNKLFEFTLKVARATIPEIPGLCAGDPARTALTTRFVVEGPVDDVVVSTTPRWRCLDPIGGSTEFPERLRTP